MSFFKGTNLATLVKALRFLFLFKYIFNTCLSCATAARFFLGRETGTKGIKNVANLVHFMMSQFLRYTKNTFTRSQDERPSIKCVSKGRGHRACGRDLFPTGKGKFFLFPALHRFHFFWILTEIILDNYEQEIIRISLYTSLFLLKVAASSSRVLIYIKYNNHIQVMELLLEERKNGCDMKPIKW